MSPLLSEQGCHMCGRDPAKGFAMINGWRYCHAGPSPTCYENVQFDHRAWAELLAENEEDAAP